MILGAAALGASLVFSTAAFFLLVPLAVATLALTFGLSAGAFVIKGIAFSVFNLVSVQAEYPTYRSTQCTERTTSHIFLLWGQPQLQAWSSAHPPLNAQKLCLHSRTVAQAYNRGP